MMGQEQLRVRDVEKFQRCKGVIKGLRGMVGNKDDYKDGDYDDGKKVDNPTPPHPPCPPPPLIPLSLYWTIRQTIRSWKIT